MSLTDDVDDEIVTPGSRCSVAVVLETMDPAVADELLALIHKTRKPASAISAALAKKWKTDLSENTINRHRRGACKCP